MNMTKQEYITQRLTQEPPIECEFKVGDLVTFTNDYGIKFNGLRVIGFSKPDHDLFKYGNFIHLDKDAYWFPIHTNQLQLEQKAPG